MHVPSTHESPALSVLPATISGLGNAHAHTINSASPIAFARNPVGMTKLDILLGTPGTSGSDISARALPAPGHTGTKPGLLGEEAMMRVFDVVVAFAALVLFLPLMLVIAAAIRLSSQGPALFSHMRVGQGGQMFPCLKFRSMVVDAQARLEEHLAESPAARAEWARDQKLRNDPRITRIGAILRKTSLDELPQLWNVLVGQMSIVGPRPIVHDEIVRYGNRFADYCLVRPGLTGLWQVSGRNDISYLARVRLDAFYSRNRSLAFNIAICLRTVPALMQSRGCY